MKFETIPETGARFQYDGRTFEITGSRPHTTRDGRDIFLITVKTKCERCGAELVREIVPNLERIPQKCRTCIREHPTWRRGQAATREPIETPPADVLAIMKRARGVRFWDREGVLPSNWVGYVIAPFLDLHAVSDKHLIHDSLCRWVDAGIIVVRSVEGKKGVKYYCEFPAPVKTKAASTARTGRSRGVSRADALLRKF